MHGHRIEPEQERQIMCIYLEALRLWVAPALSVWTHLPLVVFSLLHIWEVDASVCESCEWLLGPLRAVENHMRSKMDTEFRPLSDCPTQLPVFHAALWLIFPGPQRHICHPYPGSKTCLHPGWTETLRLFTLKLFCKFLQIYSVSETPYKHFRSIRQYRSVEMRAACRLILRCFLGLKPQTNTGWS